MDTMNDELIDYLDACLAQLDTGATLEACLATYPDHAAQLRPLLQAALALEQAAPPLPTSAQTEQMQAQMMARLQATQKAVPVAKVVPIFARPIFKQGLLAASLIIVFGLGALFVFNQDNDTPTDETEAVAIPPTEATTQAPEETVAATLPTAIAQTQPSATPSHTPSMTASELPTETALPTNTPTLLPSPTVTPSGTQRPSETNTLPPSATASPTVPTATASPPTETLAMPVFLDVTGEVKISDGTTSIAGVPIQITEELAAGEVVTISGMLLDDGTLQVDMARAATIPEQANMPRCPVSTPDCDRILLILSQSFEVPYQELATLSEMGLGSGEIARLYLLSDAGAGEIATLVGLHTAGADWNEIIAQSEDAAVKALARGVILGNGHGQTIRNRGNQPVYRGNSANAPSQQDHTPPAGNNNNPGQGNPGQGNQGQGNNGNDGGNATPPGQQNNPGNSGNAPGQQNQDNGPPGQGNNGNGNNGQGNQGNGNNGQGNNNR